MSYTTAVTDNIKSFMKRLKVFVNFNFHIVEFNLNAIEQCIIIRCTRRNIIKGINHFNNAVKDSLRQYKTKVTRCSRQCRNNQTFLNSFRVTSAATD